MGEANWKVKLCWVNQLKEKLLQTLSESHLKQSEIHADNATANVMSEKLHGFIRVNNQSVVGNIWFGRLLEKF